MTTFSLYKRTGRRCYTVAWIRGGKRMTRSTGETSKPAAHKAAESIVNPVTVSTSSLPMSTHVEAFIDTLVTRGRTPGYIAGRRTYLSRVVDDDWTVDSLSDRQHLQLRVDALAARGLSKRTQHHHRTALRQFLTWLYRNDITDRDYGSHLSSIKIRDADIVRPRDHLDDDEWASLLSSLVGTRYGMDPDTRRLLYLTAAGTGFRLGELSELHRDWVHDGYVHLPAYRSKNRCTVQQPIQPDLHDLLSQRTGQIFPTLRKGSAFLRLDLKDAGIQYLNHEGSARDFHAIRGRYITKLLEANTPVHMVQRLARHANAETTLKHYARVTGADALASALDGVQL